MLVNKPQYCSCAGGAECKRVTLLICTCQKIEPMDQSSYNIALIGTQCACHNTELSQCDT